MEAQWIVGIRRAGCALLAAALLSAACGRAARNEPRSPSTGSITPAFPATPDTGAQPASFNDPTGLAFDADGNAWVCSYFGSTLVMFTRDDLASAAGEAPDGSAAPRPDVTISGLRGPNQLAFDRVGTLWVADFDANLIAGYSPDQLRASGDPAPEFAITSSGDALRSPTDLAFDRRGTLWVSTRGTGDVVAYRAAQLRSGGTPTPAVRLHMPGGVAGDTEALAFDQRGWLWVAQYATDQILGFPPGGLLRSGSPRPAAMIRLEQGSSPVGLTVDGAGRLWTALAGDLSVEAFARPSGVVVGHPLARIAAEDLTEPHSVTFDADGNAWVTSHKEVVLRFPRSQRQSGVAATPDPSSGSESGAAASAPPGPAAAVGRDDVHPGDGLLGTLACGGAGRPDSRAALGPVATCGLHGWPVSGQAGGPSGRHHPCGL